MKRVTFDSATAVTAQEERLKPDVVAPAAESRALTIVNRTPEQPASHQAPQRHAAFLTQLLAAKAGVPQTRERRREEPTVATNVYRVHMAPTAPARGKMFSRAM